jgi:hypothetical protein
VCFLPDHVGLVRTVAVLDNVDGHFERNRPGEIGLPVATERKIVSGQSKPATFWNRKQLLGTARMRDQWSMSNSLKVQATLKTGPSSWRYIGVCQSGSRGGVIYLPASFLLVYWVTRWGQADWVFFFELWIHNLFSTIATKPMRPSGHQSGGKMISASGRERSLASLLRSRSGHPRSAYAQRLYRPASLP